MKIQDIKELVEAHTEAEIKTLTEQLENGEPLSHPVGGDDEGEQLTHLIGAAWIKEQMAANGTDFKTELRNFTSKVRNSIS
jgi:hypothetical protein